MYKWRRQLCSYITLFLFTYIKINHRLIYAFINKDYAVFQIQRQYRYSSIYDRLLNYCLKLWWTQKKSYIWSVLKVTTAALLLRSRDHILGAWQLVHIDIWTPFVIYFPPAKKQPLDNLHFKNGYKIEYSHMVPWCGTAMPYNHNSRLSCDRKLRTTHKML